MNKRQIKKRVKRAKLKKENGRIMSLEDRHYMRNYGDRYYTQKEVAFVIDDWDEIKANVRKVCDGLMDAFADVFQSLADSFRKNGGTAE